MWALAVAAWVGLLASSIQSTARPSWCSDVAIPFAGQVRAVPMVCLP